MLNAPNERTAALLRQCRWHCSEAAFALGNGRYTPAHCRELADELIELAAVLRQYATAHETAPAEEITAEEAVGETAGNTATTRPPTNAEGGT
ncbi:MULTISPECIES: hypothetical protein [unclassified Actinopolyspora]|uniref:hypothetical protein n=1 Tax=unclassified Actinopolyspora TaxID=2639451 RepID=UPI0013F5BF98|nr:MULTISPECIES: hypothetical protein [unclassified Actinopolyspora]NHD18960.1 hypothetical protein [Actinopolyspora sp. BKK2]NHE77383.1 hypothetical protein [Actinopolyspora sp. BKK1]